MAKCASALRVASVPRIQNRFIVSSPFPLAIRSEGNGGRQKSKYCLTYLVYHLYHGASMLSGVLPVAS
jgi:hypothetical protein